MKMTKRDKNHKAVWEYIEYSENLARRFAEHMDWEWSDNNHQIAETGELWFICDCYITMHDMCTVLWLSIKPSEFMVWYNNENPKKDSFSLFLEKRYAK